MAQRSGDGGGRLRPGPGQDPERVAADQRARLEAAMTDLVYEGGYPLVTVRGLVARARVTKPTFYRLFSGKEACFMAAYDRAVDEAIGWTASSTQGRLVRADLIGSALGSFCLAFTTEPAAAKLALIEPTSVGGEAAKRLRHTEARFAELVARRFRELDPTVELPRGIALGMIAGVARVARRRIDADDPENFVDDLEPLSRWALVVSDVRGFEAFLQQTAADPADVFERTARPPQLDGHDDRTVLINSAMQLLIERGYAALTVAEISAVAGLPKRRFEAQFDSIAECFSASIELAAAAAAAEVTAAYRAGPASTGFSRVAGALTKYLAANPGLARLLFVEIFLPGRAITRRGAGVLSGFAALLGRNLPWEGPHSVQSTEASVGAIWALIRNEVEQERYSSLPSLAPLLAWFALAPGRPD